MTKRPDYLKRYSDRYRLVRREDGIWHILTRYPDHKLGMTYDVYDYDEDRLAACLPPGAARGLLKRLPEVFTVHQGASDAVVLLFEESKLHELSDVLRLRRKKQVSEAERQRLAEMSQAYSPIRSRAISKGERTDPEPAISVRRG